MHADAQRAPGGPTTYIGYAVISLVSNLGHTRRVLLVQGKSKDDIEPASDFSLQCIGYATILNQVQKGYPNLTDFDLVLETKFMRCGSLDAKPLALHTYSSP